jgi:hypothetical protein
LQHRHFAAGEAALPQGFMVSATRSVNPFKTNPQISSAKVPSSFA